MSRVGPRTEQIVVRVSLETAAALDATAAHRGTTRSDVVRRLIVSGLARQDHDLIDLAEEMGHLTTRLRRALRG